MKLLQLLKNLLKKPSPRVSKLTQRSTKSTYEATYYLMMGAKLERVRSTPVPSNKIGRKGFHDQWTITLRDIPTEAVIAFQEQTATVNVAEFEYTRINLKREIKAYLADTSPRNRPVPNNRRLQGRTGNKYFREERRFNKAALRSQIQSLIDQNDY